MGGRKRLRWKKRLSQRCWLNTMLLYLDGSFWAEHGRHGNYHKRRLSHPKNEKAHLQLNTGGASHISKTISESISQESQTAGGQRGLDKTSRQKMQAGALVRALGIRAWLCPFWFARDASEEEMEKMI